MKGIKEYAEEDQKPKSSPETWELYEKFRDAIVNLEDDITVVPQKYYISFRVGYNISCIILRKSKIIISINFRGRKKLDDPRHLARDVSKIGHHGTGDYELHVSNDENLEYIMSLIKQTLHD